VFLQEVSFPNDSIYFGSGCEKCLSQRVSPRKIPWTAHPSILYRSSSSAYRSSRFQPHTCRSPDPSPSLSYSPFELACSVFEMNIGTHHRAIRANPNFYPSRMGQRACNVFTGCVFRGRLLRTFPTCTYQPLKLTMQCGSTSFKLWYVCLAATFISKYPILWYFRSVPPKSKLKYLNTYRQNIISHWV
jgi:hypothetical protein